MANREEASSSKLPDEEAAAPAKVDTVVLWMSSENCALRRAPLSHEEIGNLCVVCTSCGSQINHHDKSRVHFHRLLNVLVCKRCFRFYGDGQFKKDDSGTDEYCSWCAEGGSLLVCDKCTRAFCKNCIRRNLSRREMTRVSSLKEWHCYVCDPAPLVPMVNYAKMIGNYSRQLANSTSAGTSDAGGSMKLSEAEVQKLALEKAMELQRSLSTLATSGGQEELLASMSKLLRDHARSLSRIAQSAEECQKRKMKSRKKKAEQKGANEGQESSASVDSQPSNATKRAKNKKLLVLDEVGAHFSSSDQEGPSTKRDEHSKGGDELDAKSDAHSAIVNSAAETASAPLTEVAAESTPHKQYKNATKLESKSNARSTKDSSDTGKLSTLQADGAHSSGAEPTKDAGNDCHKSALLKSEGQVADKKPIDLEECDSLSRVKKLHSPSNTGGGAISVDDTENDVGCSVKEVADNDVKEETLAQKPENNKKEDAAPAPIDIPPVLSLGDEFSPVVLNDESENESESLLADLFAKRKNDADKSEIIPETPPKKEEELKAADEQAEQDPGELPADARRRESVSTVDMSSSNEDSVKIGKVARKVKKSAGKASVSSADSVDEDSRATESFPSSGEGENKQSSPQKSVRQKKRTPLSKDAKARRALIRSLHYTSKSSSEDELDDPSTSTPRTPKHRSPRKRRRTSSGSAAQLSESASKCLERASEKYGDPKLEMTASVEVQRLDIDPAIIAAAKMEIEGNVDHVENVDDEEKEIARLLAPIRIRRKVPDNEESDAEMEEAPESGMKEGEDKKKEAERSQKQKESCSEQGNSVGLKRRR